MAIEKDIEYFRKDPTSGEITLDYVVRPKIRKNSIGPLPTGSVVEIKIFKNNELAVKFIYTVEKEVVLGKRLYAAATLDFSERNIESFKANEAGEVIVCKDTEILVKNEAGELVLDHIERPRNVRRDNIGGYVLNDECRVELVINNTIMDSMDYKVMSAPKAGEHLLACGSVDFVEMNWPQDLG